MEEDRRPGEHAGRGAAGQLSLAKPDALAALAARYGVTTGYEGTDGQWRPAPEASVRAALRVMGVHCDTQAEITASLNRAEQAPWRRSLPACTVLRASGRRYVTLRLPAGVAVTARVRTEAGDTVEIRHAPEPTGRGTRLDDGTERVEAQMPLPDDLPTGYHTVEIEVPGSESASGHLIVAPDRCPDPDRFGPTWGLSLQLYAARSERSWGVGDFDDLRRLAAWTAGLGGDFALVNPLHAATPVIPQEPSPYYPSSRRFTNPLYLAVDRVPEVRGLDPDVRERATDLALQLRATNTLDTVDRDGAFRAKDEVLSAAFAAMDPGRRDALAAYRRREGQSLEDFATFCALAEQYGVPFQAWPADLHHPASAAVTRARVRHAERIAYHAWLQFLCDEQLADAQQEARAAGARLGIVHDLAVGVDPGGADAWALQDTLGLGVSVGAPPDAFNQQGQDWQQPPLLPNRLPELGYEPFRRMLRSVLDHAGGVRIDHVIGLFRLFWIPSGAAPTEGTYVRYPADDLLAILALEAQRAQAIVIGEDLGTVEEGVRDTLADRAVLSSSVLYFERDPEREDARRPSARYPRQALASVTTHDLPTAAGWWSDEDVRLRVELGLLGPDASAEAERAHKARERASMEALLSCEGLLDGDAAIDERVDAMHAFLARTPAALVAVNLPDAVGDLRQPNLPGTLDEYPNWRLPLARPGDGGHEPVLVEHLRDHPRVPRLVDTLRAAGRGRIPSDFPGFPR